MNDDDGDGDSGDDNDDNDDDQHHHHLILSGAQLKNVHSGWIHTLWREGSHPLGLQLPTIPSQGEADAKREPCSQCELHTPLGQGRW